MFHWSAENFDTLSQRYDSVGTPFVNTHTDSLRFRFTVNDGAIHNAEHFDGAKNYIELIGRNASGDFLLGDSNYPGYAWQTFRGMDTANTSINPPTTTIQRNVQTDLGFESYVSTTKTCYGAETLSVPAGLFAAIRTRDSSYHLLTGLRGMPDTVILITTIWYVPSLGCYGKWTHSANAHDIVPHQRQYEVHVLTGYGP